MHCEHWINLGQEIAVLTPTHVTSNLMFFLWK